jgi:hypothetical protein
MTMRQDSPSVKTAPPARIDARALRDLRVARVAKKLDLLESNHGCGLNALSRKSIPNRT